MEGEDGSGDGLIDGKGFVFVWMWRESREVRRGDY